MMQESSSQNTPENTPDGKQDDGFAFPKKSGKKIYLFIALIYFGALLLLMKSC